MPRGLFLLLFLCACGDPRPIPGRQVAMEFQRGRDVWRAPVPSNDLLTDDGHVDTSAFPNPQQNNFVKTMLDLLARDAHGFSTAGAIFFRFNGAVGTLPTLEESTGAASPIWLVSVDPGSPDYGTRYPFRAEFLADGGPYGAANMLSILPQQGRPLRPNTTYAAIILRKLKDDKGALLGLQEAMAQLAFNQQPAGMSKRAFTDYTAALRVLDRDMHLLSSTIAGMTVFTTDDVTGVLQKGRDVLLAEPRPALEAPFARLFTYDDYCVFQTTIQVPVLQNGIPPYFSSGGEWVLGDDGVPTVQKHERANLIVTLPRAPMPAAGYPTVVYMRQGGAGKIPIADRGVQMTAGGPTVPGSGPAQEFAKVGYAGVSLDGPNGGEFRNPAGTDEQILLFNFFNPVAMRDNMRESAVEIDLLASMLDGLVIDASSCPGGNAGAHLDTSKLVLMGHSTGAWITPIAAAFEPRFKNVIMSGAGASWVENIVFKQSPVNVKVIGAGLLSYQDREIDEFDPAVMLAQWAADPADPQNYAPHIIDRPPADPRNVLVFQGIVDTYIMPPIANALQLSTGTELGGTPLDDTILPWAKQTELPAQGNRGGVTAVAVQYQKDMIEDGHEVMFQREEPKYQYRCFLRTLRDEGAPRVPPGLASPEVCP
jgi:hypothetical protein